ncbi:MAG: flagellar basal body-associated FliL family protein [Nitrospirota bacterium]
MAEAAAVDTAAAEKETKNPAPPAPRSLPVKLVLMIGAAALLLGLGGAIAFMKFTGGHAGEGARPEQAAPAESPGAAAPGERTAQAGPPEKGAPGTMFDMDSFIVNLADAPEVRYLKLTLKLELEQPDVAADLSARMPQVRDGILILLSSKDSSGLRTTQGKFQLRDEITHRVNSALPKAGVRTAYFTEFVVQ